ncbi:MAG: GcrA family cell cycle regulator [Rhodospirillaceae bacterium]|nr:GcrA family cell cycle regulator [Rhodospirillaceae bacterium]
MQWTDERISLLKQLWGQGMTASQIAERLGGVSRNAVIGKAHRLGLSSRPSPIRGGVSTGPRPARRRSSARLATAAAAPTAPATATVPMAPRIEAPAPKPAPRRSAASGGSRACMWPLGDPKDQNFHFCEAPAEAGRPYCHAHCTQAYQKRSEEAA